MWGESPTNYKGKFMDKNVRFLVKAGSKTARKNYVPLLGEIIATNDDPRLFLGDGVTVGGKPLSIKTHIVDVINDLLDDDVIVGDFAFALTVGALYICVGKDDKGSPILLDLLYRRVNEVYVVHALTGEHGIVETVDENLPEYVTNDSRYVLNNPFGSRGSLVIPELYINNEWTVVGQGAGGLWSVSMYGLIAGVKGGTIVIQTARDYVYHADPSIGGLHTAEQFGNSPAESAKCRLRVVEVG